MLVVGIWCLLTTARKLFIEEGGWNGDGAGGAGEEEEDGGARLRCGGGVSILGFNFVFVTFFPFFVFASEWRAEVVR